MRMVDPAVFFESHPGAIEETLLPPWNSVDLAAMVHRDYQCRLGSRSENIAELYHDNSKNVRGSTRQIYCDQRSAEHILRHQIESSYAPDPDHIGNLQESAAIPRTQWTHDVPAALHGLGLKRVERFYAIDAYVLSDARLLKILPGKSILWLERHLDASDMASLHDSFFGPAAQAARNSGALVFFVGVPWRHMMLRGPRGYRSMLVDLGVILADFEPAMRAREIVQLEHFYDNEVDRILGFDGIVHSVQAILGATAANKSKNGAGEDV